MNTAIQNIVIFGGGLAAHLTAASLSERLPRNLSIKFVRSETFCEGDIFFGNVTSPTIYDFFLSIGLSEPELLLNTDSSFSLGTRYEKWGEEKLRWTQAFYRPLPIQNGIKFHHYVKRIYGDNIDWSLDPYIMSVAAAEKGVFAHPPEGKNIPLINVQYGYHFAPESWVKLLANKLERSRVQIIEGKVSSLEFEAETLKSLILDSGHSLTGDLFIDCRSQDQNTQFENSRDIQGASFTRKTSDINSVVRTLTETNFGWKASTALNGREHVLCIFDEKDRAEFENDNSEAAVISSIKIGRNAAPWKNNILKLGPQASALEPLTPAPMMALQRDIDRLTELIPSGHDMVVEAREYNRRFVQDYDNSAMFQRALFSGDEKFGSAYRRKVLTVPMPDRLQAKLTQFKNRGIFVGYDYEPFTEQDWTLLYFGIGLRPERYDPLTDCISESQIKHMLDNVKRANAQMVTKLPPHGLYMKNLLKFLKEKHG